MFKFKQSDIDEPYLTKKFILQHFVYKKRLGNEARII